MAATDRYWIGTTDGDFAVNTNWEGAVVPIDGDTLHFNDQAIRGMDGGAVAAKGFEIVVDEGFIFGIGSSGTPFAPALAISTLIFNGSTSVPCYFESAATIDVAIIDTQSARESLVELDGSIGQITVLNGGAALNSTATVTGRIVTAGNGKLLIPSGVTLANVEVVMNGGRIDDEATVTLLTMNGGEFFLGGTAAATEIDMYGGTTIWDAKSTITLLEAYGGTFKTRKSRNDRILTNANMYGNAILDFRQGGHGITFSNPIRCHGNNQPLFPRGSTVTSAL